MRQARYNDKIEVLLQKKGVIYASDFIEVCEGMPAPSVYSKIRKLTESGKITVVGKGKYIAVNKLKYSPDILKMYGSRFLMSSGTNWIWRNS